MDIRDIVDAPKDGTLINMYGHKDVMTCKKSYKVCSWNKEYEQWVTTKGWIFFPDYWVKE